MTKRSSFIAGFALIALFLWAAQSSAIDDGHRWQIRKSTHFVISYIDAPSDFIDTVMEEAEDYYNQITYDFGFLRQDFWLWENRAKIYIYRDAEDYHKSTGQPEWTGGVTSYQNKEIFTYPLASGFFDTLLPHELGHIIFREFVGLKTRLPLWLDEGVAAFQEKSRRWGSNKIVKNAIEQGVFIPLEELSKVDLRGVQDRATVELLYAEFSSIVYFLIVVQGKQNFVEFCKGLRDGKNIDEALSSAYVKYRNLKELNEAWTRYIRLNE